MPLIVKSPRDRLFLRSGCASTARSLSELVDQLQEQLRAAHAQNVFNCSQYEKQIALLLRDLAEAKYELARRDTRDALANAPTPSSAVH